MTITGIPERNHGLLEFDDIQCAKPFFYGFFIVFIILWFQNYFARTIQKYYPTCEFTTDEVLDDYTTALSLNSVNWWYMEEKLCRDILGYKMLNDDIYKKFKARVEDHKTPKVLDMKRKPIEGTFNYNILCNKRYEELFQYVPYMTKKREKFIKDGDDNEFNDGFQSDLISISLNLPFLSRELWNNFKFGKEGFEAMTLSEEQ